MKPLTSVQGLRALAALGVLMFHACQWSGMDFAVGAAGVDLFFLISGFVLWLSAERAPPSPAAFLAARAVRVAPMYWFWTLIIVALAWRWPAMLPVVHLTARHAILSLAFVPHPDPWGGPFPLLPSGWTLTYEAFFYLVFAFSLALPRDRRFQALAVMLTITSLIGFAYHRWYTLLANPLLLEFLAGAALARAWRSGTLGRLGGTRTGFAAIAVGVMLLALQQALGVRSDFWRPLIFGAPAFLILSGALKLEGAVRRGGAMSAAIVRLGDASYSLYLCHLPVVAVVLALTPGLAGPSRAALTVPLALAIGLAAYSWIERPVTAGLRRRLGSGQPQPLTVPARRAATAVTGARRIGAGLGSGEGRPNRKPWP